MKLSPRQRLARFPVTCLLLAATVGAQNGLTGLPTKTYDPVCAMACVRSLYTLTLSCSTGGDMLGMVAFTTSSDCWAENDEYLKSLAYCMRTHCEGLGFTDSKLEIYSGNNRLLGRLMLVYDLFRPNGLSLKPFPKYHLHLL